MNRYPWFRLYAEARTDAKLRTLTDAQFRVWFNLLCYASEQEERGTIPPMDSFLLAVEVAGGDEPLLAETIARLVALRMIDSGDAITFRKFTERQYDKPSDSAEQTRLRKQKERAKKREVTRDESVTKEESRPMSRDVTRGHAPEKRREEEIRAEEIVPPSSPPVPERPDPSPPDGGATVRAAPKPSTLTADEKRAFERWYSGYPNKQHRPEAERAWKKLNPDAPTIVALCQDIIDRRHGRKWSEGYIEHPATYLNNRVWEDDIEPIRLTPSRASPNGRRPTREEANDRAFREAFGHESADVPEVIEATFRRH